MHLRHLLILSFLVLVVAACRTDAEPVLEVETATPSLEPTVGESPLSPSATTTLEPTVGESPLSPPPTPTPAPPGEGDGALPQPEISPIATPSDPVADVVAAASEYLASELDISSQGVEPVLVESVEWSDASLGCPEPGKSYAQVITPGYRIVLRVGEKEYELHTDRDIQRVVICDRTRGERSAAAVEYLAAELGIPAEEIDVLSVERYEWPDTSLGCPEPGASYAQVVTPGYSVILRAQYGEYEVHTDLEGRVAVICEQQP